VGRPHSQLRSLAHDADHRDHSLRSGKGEAHEEFVGLLGSFEKPLGHSEPVSGLHLEDYPASVYEGIDRFTAGWFKILLVPVCLPLVPHIMNKLENGARVAD
jgi:hypothetical protein